MLQSFISDFIDTDMIEADGKLPPIVLAQYTQCVHPLTFFAAVKPMHRLSTNQRETMREQCMCNMQRQRAIVTSINEDDRALAHIVDAHRLQVQVGVTSACMQILMGKCLAQISSLRQ
jgi:hypothetical protein